MRHHPRKGGGKRLEGKEEEKGEAAVCDSREGVES